MPIKGENTWKFAASILLFLSGVGPAFGQAEMKSFLFLQNDYPVFISTDGKKLNEQIMYLSADDEYVRLHYTFCETAKEAPALNASRELNKAAVYGGHCDYQILSAPVGDLTNVSLLCSVRTGEIIAASSPEGVSGLSQAVDWSPMKKTPAECPVVGTGWNGFFAIRAPEPIARMPLAFNGSDLITAGWVNGKLAFLSLDTGASSIALNFSSFSIPVSGAKEVTLGDGSATTLSTGSASFCYVGTLCSTVAVDDIPAKAEPLLGLSFLGLFDKVTINMTDHTLDLIVKKKAAE